MKSLIKNFLLLATFSATVNVALAQSSDTLPVPGIAPARDVPGAQLLPDPSVVHKVVFDVVNAAPSVDEVNPWLPAIARYVNTLAEHGVPAENRQIAVVFHQGSTPMILKNDEYKARNDGADNPNIDLIRSLANAGVKFHVCGQAVLGREIEPATIQPEIQLDLWALTTLIDLQLDGYVLIGG